MNASKQTEDPVQEEPLIFTWEALHGWLKQMWGTVRRFLILMLFALIAGTVIGFVGAFFGRLLHLTQEIRGQYPWIVYLLPVSGLLIVWLCHFAGRAMNAGTNLIINTVRGQDKVPAMVAPLIFVTTVLTHLFGGSAGREGAALQLGGSLGSWMGGLFKLDESGRRIALMCGMSAAFSALFGTPLAATIFSMELFSIGIMYYAALAPCALAAVLASRVALHCGLAPERFHIPDPLDSVNVPDVLRVLALAALCAGLSILVCLVLHGTSHLMRTRIPNPYLRALIGGTAVILITLALDTRDYMGAGVNIIERALEGQAAPGAFFWKLLLTAVTLSAGFRGGEIVPTLFIGATFGCTVGPWLGIPAPFAAAVGMTSLFCGVTNCPITALLITLELFGFTSPPYFLLALAVSYSLSGYYSLYKEQTIVYDKLEIRFVDRKAND